MRNLTIWQAAAIASEVGLALAATVLVGTFAGLWLDSQVANGLPIFTFAGALLGLVAGVYSIAQLVPYLTRPRKE